MFKKMAQSGLVRRGKDKKAKRKGYVLKGVAQDVLEKTQEGRKSQWKLYALKKTAQGGTRER